MEQKVRITPKQAADLLNRKMQTLAQWRVEGRGPAFEKYGRSVLYVRKDVEEWRKANAQSYKFTEPESLPKRRKSLIPKGATPEQPGAADREAVTVSLLGSNTAALEGVQILVPVNLHTLTIADMLLQFKELALMTLDGVKPWPYGILKDEHWRKLSDAPEGASAPSGRTSSSDCHVAGGRLLTAGGD
jgi:hypothetical protein